jgi:hypothetical protein
VWGEEALVTEPMKSFQVRGRQVTLPPPTYRYESSYILRGFEVVNQ